VSAHGPGTARLAVVTGRAADVHAAKRQETKRIALTDPRDLDQPFAIWSLATLASYLVDEGVVRDILNAATTKVMFVDDKQHFRRRRAGIDKPFVRN
jgi:hypothetical protein